MKLGDGTIARAIARGLKERFPVGGAILETLGPEAVRAISGQHEPDPEKMAARLEAAAAVDPVIKNNLNLESPLQSGTTWGNGITLVAVGPALGLVIWQYWQTGAVSQEAFIALFALLFAAGGGAVFSLARRWLPNLKPLGK